MRDIYSYIHGSTVSQHGRTHLTNNLFQKIHYKFDGPNCNIFKTPKLE